MTVLDGFIPTAPEGTLTNSRLSLGMHAFAMDAWPPYQSEASGRLADYLDRHFPVSTTGREITGSIRRAFFDDFYNQIHVRPQKIALGNVVSTQSVLVDVWNAYFVSQTLSSITGIEEGISVTGEAVLPMVFAAGQYEEWDVSVSPTGPSNVDARITWVFDSIPDGWADVTGNRIVAFSFTPNWRDGVGERLEWKTDVLPSITGAEQRRAIRVTPRREFTAKFIVEGRDRALADNVVHAWGGMTWSVPIWHDIQVLAAPLAAGVVFIPCTTAHRDFAAGALVVLRGQRADQYEAAEVESVDVSGVTLARPTLADWPAGTRLYPARTAKMARQPRIRRAHDAAWEMQATFDVAEPCEWPELTMSTYRSHPVFEERPDEGDELDITFERILAELDNDSAAPYVLDTAAAGFMNQQHAWVMHGPQERTAFRSFLYAMRGRQLSVWVPTHADDFRLVTSTLASDPSITVENVGFSRYGFGQVGRRDIRVQLRNGTVFYRRIVDASEIDAESEQVTMDSAFGVVVAPGDVSRISFMRLMRLDDDAIDIRHVTDLEGVATSSVGFRTVRDDI